MAVGDELIVADGGWFKGLLQNGHQLNVIRPKVDQLAAPRKDCTPDSFEQDPENHRWCCRPHAIAETQTHQRIFTREWWRYYHELPRIDQILTSWDMAFKDTDGSDYVVGQVWGRNLANRYLLGSIRARLDFTATLKAVQELEAWAATAWPRVSRSIAIEDAANGPAIISARRDHVQGIVPVKPGDGKEERAHAVAAQVEAGNIHLPEGRIPAPPGYGEGRTDDFLEEIAAFQMAPLTIRSTL